MEEIALELNKAIETFFYADLTSFDWSYRSSPNKWSKKEIIGHLIDSAQINLQRFVRCTYEENFKLIYYQNEWVLAQRYQDANLNDLLTLWRLLNEQIVRVLKDYPADRTEIQCDTSKTEVSFHPVRWLAADYIVHMNHHLKQITTI